MSLPPPPPPRVAAGATGDAPGGTSPIPFAVAVVAWIACWVAGSLLAGAALAGLGHDPEGDPPAWATVVGATCLWVAVLAALIAVSQRHGSGFRSDYGFAIRPADALGVPIGVACQVVLVPLVYWPLGELWPDTFSAEALERYARDITARADGMWMVAVVVVVAAGAPVVEELLYRGLLQRSLARQIDPRLAVLVVATWFAAIHFRPVELPGLFVFGLVLGVCAWRTGRIGMSIVAHAAFNVVGLIAATA